ncbi:MULTISPECIES: LysR substrate-binding domain-containing protein [unclassified Mesorhizobium]|uniref:LysR substrate-binding domain-containing protein n=1 Tax=unclassified Mesorhizobium TaxID=325217 RepID=UPI000FCB8543|nr:MULTISPECIES: LysR substrate-binding domain-containing protein [unclassified Mesorhizobium]RUU63834.1 LysR family transcriptional regulator [Mesorhizobium sp. M7A.T.Ca.TU.009.01.1.1]RUT85386.1 LysR family transcriptional regulator [Mesorhizobium sp. M7A.T.Ca.US.000.02.1.1]RUT93408.1 LysR family transcriptional regulator [Mesorhizobium sp. M7A.T.Ca.US.000.02.2.1]RUU02399.1 LysR family transcriptional regulator [Mesorhizobium sp. M7A.T.Ca.TU.009.02.1.1]RVD13269.1 LysR family transcriptional r
MAAPLDLNLLKTFVAVVESGSLSNAAPRVGRSQSAVSMQMQRLEEMVGNQLLVRGPRTVTPNAIGEDFLIYARRLLKLSDEAWASVTRPKETGSVRLGVPDDYAAFLLPPVLSRFAAEHPLVTVELICEQSTALVKTLAEGRLDLAIITRLPEQPLEVIRLERFVWVASPNHVAWEADPLPVALFEPGCAARMNVLQALGDADRSYRCTYSSASLLGLIAVVQAGLAVAGLAMRSVPPSLRIVGGNEGLPVLPDLEIGILRNPLSTTQAVERLNDFLRRDLAQQA